MATDLEKLVVQLSLQMRQYETALNRANGITARQMRSIENRARQMNKNLDAIFSRSFSGLTAPLAGVTAALGAREIASYADEWTRAGNLIRSAATSAGVEVRSLEALKEGANNARTSLSDYTDLYARLIRSASAVANSESEIALATDLVSKAFKAGGASAQEQAAGILQLGQALGSGVLQGDELRSLRENAPILAKAIADEFKVSISGLKQLGAEGKLTSDRVFKAILNAQKPIEAQFKATNATIKDAFTQVNNEFIAYIGNADASAGASANLVSSLQYLADNFKGVADAAVAFATIIISALSGRAIAGMVVSLGNAVTALGVLLTALRTGAPLAASFSAALGPIGLLAGAAAASVYLLSSRQTEAEKAAEIHQKSIKELSFQIETLDWANKEAVGSTRKKIEADLEAAKVALSRAKAERELAASIVKEEISPSMSLLPAPEATDVQNTVDNSPAVRDRQAVIDQLSKQIDELSQKQKDFEDIASGRKKPTRNTDGFGGGIPTTPDDDKKSRKKRTPADRFDDDIRRVNDRTAATVAETEALRNINPLINDYGYAMEKARTEQELLNAAQKAGVTITPELRAQITQTADQWAYATAEANKLAEAQDKIRQRSEEWQDAQKDALRGVVGDLVAGKSAAEAFAGALQKIADKLLDMAFDDLFTGLFKGSGGGLLGGLIPGFASGGYTGAGGKYVPAGVVHKGEYVFDQEAVRKAGGPAALEAMRRSLKGYATGGAVGMPSISAPRMPILKASSSSTASGPMNINIDVSGSMGDKDLEARAYAGAQRAIDTWKTSKDFKMRAWEQANLRVLKPRGRP